MMREAATEIRKAGTEIVGWVIGFLSLIPSYYVGYKALIYLRKKVSIEICDINVHANVIGQKFVGTAVKISNSSTSEFTPSLIQLEILTSCQLSNDPGGVRSEMFVRYRHDDVYIYSDKCLSIPPGKSESIYIMAPCGHIRGKEVTVRVQMPYEKISGVDQICQVLHFYDESSKRHARDDIKAIGFQKNSAKSTYKCKYKPQTKSQRIVAVAIKTLRIEKGQSFQDQEPYEVSYDTDNNIMHISGRHLTQQSDEVWIDLDSSTKLPEDLSKELSEIKSKVLKNGT